MTYDHWKSTNPADEFLGPEPDEEDMANDLTEPVQAGIPDWMRKASTGVRIGNVDSSDLKPPRLKILAGQSPEVMDGIPDASPGNFWLTIFNQNLGKQVSGTPILLKKSYQLWHPRVVGKGSEGPLATASDGINWDVPNQTFDVTFPPNEGGGTAKWKIGKRVDEYRMNQFGSSRPGDKKSKPAATMTYDMLWMIDMPNGKKQLCLFTSSRTGIVPTQNFISTQEAMGVDHYFQRYRIEVIKKTNNATGDPYFTFVYHFDGLLVDSQQDAMAMKALFDKYAQSGFATDLHDEAADIDTARNTVGTRRDYSNERGPGEVVDDDIPF
jgi:hypothetical protein